MFRVLKNLSFCYGHRLLEYPGKCVQLHGHNALVQVEFFGQELDRLGMLIDFDEIHRIVKSFLDENLDHKMVLNVRDPFVEILRANGEPVFVMEENPTAENLAKLIFEHVARQGLPIRLVRFWETPTSCAEYSQSVS